ncbi:MAG TPA: hypothetical protein VHC69_21315 [Polyangiaceae bacterium]|nr:hypothetical protein [Polyangiaceae bacterium]
MHSTHPGSKPSGSPMRRFRVVLAALISVVAAGFGAVACLNRPLCDVDCRPKTTNIFVDQITQKSVDKIDLLFMIDNSISMADKQQVLQAAVPDLVQRLVNPNCVDPADGTPGTPAPNPTTECSGNLIREFQPIRNIHVGIVTSSIGSHGAPLCAGNDADPVLQEQNDHGYLIGVRPRYMNPAGGFPADKEGFLDWNPDTNMTETLDSFTTTFKAMVTEVGEQGCGLESQLEAIYRFLIDPNPYQQITVAACPGAPNEQCAVPTGKDTNLLAQRAAFLRPDSLVAIIFMTDENDCSIQESGQNYYAAQSGTILPHGSAICATNPNDKCCYFCGSAPPTGCTADPSCQGSAANLTLHDDPINLRCWHQKQRFGYDFLYPTARYVNAFSQPQICTSRPDLAPDVSTCKDLDGDKKPDLFDNPLFVGANGSSAIPRDTSLIFVAGIVGVPYQDLQTQTKPDGTMYPTTELHFRTAAQMMTDQTWAVILGDDGTTTGNPPINPTDNLMVEARDPRGGMDGENPPVALAPPDSPRNANPVNGHEWVNSDGTDLQYACIFPLPATRDCATLLMQTPQPGCDCKPGTETDKNPLCEDQAGNYSATQWAAKGYPGIRELQVLKDFGANGIVASICAKNLSDSTRQDYGYRPAVDAIVDRLKEALTGKCLPRTLTVDPVTKTVPCSVVEVRPSACLGTPGRIPAPAAVIQPVITRLQETKVCDAPGKPACNSLNLCEIEEATGDDCHKNQSPTETGWCYVDPAANPNDDPTLVDKCPPTQRRIIRFVDPMNNTPAHDATVLIACFGATVSDATGGAGGM